MDFSPWKSLKSDGTIPADYLPSTAFQLQWTLKWELTPSGAGYTNHWADWTWRVLTGVGGATIFDSRTRFYGIAVWLADVLVTWYVQFNANNPVIATTVPIKPPLLGVGSDATSWYQRSDGTWGNQAETGYKAEASTDAAGAGLESFTVYAVYESAVYLVPLPAGAVVSVPKYIGGMFFKPQLNNVRIRTAGGGRFGTMYDRPGFHRIIGGGSGNKVWQYFSGDDGRNYTPRRVGPMITNPCVTKDLTNRLFVSGLVGRIGWFLYVSENDGITWQQEGARIMFDASYSDCRIVTARDGSVVAVARKGGFLWCRNSRDGFAATVRVCESKKAVELAQDGLGTTLIVTDGGMDRWVSRDGGTSWEKVRGTALF